MDCTKRTSVGKVTLFALIFVGLCSRSSSTICVNWYNYCRLEAVSITTDDEATNFVFPNGPGIAFYKSKILSPAKLLFGRLPDFVKTVYISDSNVPKVYINHTIDKFIASESSVQEVIIDRTGTFMLRELWIANNPLRSVPENIGKLTNLVELHLIYNKIETVSMDHFKDLTNLKILSLYYNSIVHVDTTVPLNLPNLESISFGNNSLPYLSISFWNFPNLKEIYLYQNKLRNIKKFPRQFPKLQSTYIKANRWSCAWLETIKYEMSKISEGTESCSGKSVDKICCQDYSIDDFNFNSLEEPIAFWLLQIDGKILKLTTDTRMLIDTKVSDVDRTVQKITDEVKSLESNVKKEMFQELQKINAKVDENRVLVVNDQKNFQKEIEQIGASISKLTTEIQEKVKSLESNIIKEVLQELAIINERVLENQASIVHDRKQFQQTSEKLQKGIDTIGERVLHLTTDTTVLIDNKMSDIGRTIQGIKEEVKSMDSSVMQQAEEIQKVNVKITDDRKLLEEKISNSDNQNKDEIKRVKQKLNENRALIEDVVEDLYLEELEKQEL